MQTFVYTENIPLNSKLILVAVILIFVLSVYGSTSLQGATKLGHSMYSKKKVNFRVSNVVVFIG